MNLTFQYTPENLQEAYSLHYKKAARFRGQIMLFLGILLIWTGLLLTLASLNKGRQMLNYSLVFYGIIIIIIYTLTMNTLGKRNYKRLKDHLDTINISADKQGIVMATEKGERKIDWESIQFAVKSKTMVLLYPSKSSFYIFPRKNFNAGEFEAFSELTGEKVKVIK